MSRIRNIAATAFAVALLAGATLSAQTNHRPVEDFLAAQVNITWWGSYNYDPARWVIVDYSGMLNGMLLAAGLPGLGTTYEGEVTEKALADGQARVHVVLHGTNVFMRAIDDYNYALFGYNIAQVIGGATPAVGEFVLVLDFVNPAGVGAPLPDLLDLLNLGVIDMQLNARAEGPLRLGFGVPNGTPGRLHLVQRALAPAGQGVPGQDYWPAELVTINVVGQ